MKKGRIPPFMEAACFAHGCTVDAHAPDCPMMREAIATVESATSGSSQMRRPHPSKRTQKIRKMQKQMAAMRLPFRS